MNPPAAAASFESRVARQRLDANVERRLLFMAAPSVPLGGVVVPVDEVLGGAGDLEHSCHSGARIDQAHVWVASARVEEDAKCSRVEERHVADVHSQRPALECGKPPLEVRRGAEVAVAADA